MNHLMLFALCVGLLTIGCKNDDGPNCDIPALENIAACAPPVSTNGMTARELMDAYVAENNLTAQETASGMYYVIEREGEGSDRPDLSSRVTVDYVGYYRNECRFDGTNNISFGLANLIAGWKEGIPLVGRCGTIKLIIPPALAYGENPQNGIQAGEPLIFDINLLDF